MAVGGLGCSNTTEVTSHLRGHGGVSDGRGGVTGSHKTQEGFGEVTSWLVRTADRVDKYRCHLVVFRAWLVCPGPVRVYLVIVTAL